MGNLRLHKIWFTCAWDRPFTVKASSVWISWTVREQINDVVLKTYISYVRSLHHYFRMKHLTFLTSNFILFTHYPVHDLTSVRLAFRTWGLQLPLSGIAFGPRYIVSRSAFGVSTHERGRNLTRKGQSNYKIQYWIQSLAKYLRRSVCSGCSARS